AAHKGGAELYGGGAQHESCGSGATVGDATRGDDRDANRIHDLWQQREQPCLHANVDIGKRCAMTASLAALRNDGINAAPFEYAGFGHRRCTRLDEDASGFDRFDDLLIGQAEVEADNLRLLL